MKTIDVCESPLGVGVIKQYYENNNTSDYTIIGMWLNLSVGDIKNNHLSYIRELYQIDNYGNNDAINELLNNIDIDTNIRIWSSKGDDDDYLLLLFICNLLKGKCNNISVIFSTDYNEYAWSINAIDYKEIEPMLKYEKKLTIEDIEKYSIEWNRQVEFNSELRVLENGKIINKKFSDYDDIILDRLNNMGKCKIANLIADMMINRVINDSGDLLYLYLIDRLIEQNKIRIVERKEKHFIDLIEINK